MLEIISYYKPLGYTPLQAIEKLKSEQPELVDVPITYAGRLDPMAEGLLLLLAGDAVHRKQEFLDLPKTYKAKILLGFSSDTFDVLGIATKSGSHKEHKDPQELITAVQSLVGTHNFPYPPYSSKTIDGKALWVSAREGDIDVANLPVREMTVLSAENISVSAEPWENVYSEIVRSINLVSGNFRQNEILQRWKEIDSSMKPNQELQIISATFTVTSGTYIRTLAHELGKVLGTGALLLHLDRTKVGEYYL